MVFDNSPTNEVHSKPSFEIESAWLQRDRNLFESKLDNPRLSLDVCNLQASHKNVDDVDLYELANSEDD
jgi:hypothetical protein